MNHLLDDWAAKIEPHGAFFTPEPPESVARLEGAVGGRLPETLVTLLRRHGASGFAGSASVETGSGRSFGIFTLFGVDQILEDREAHPDYRQREFLPIADDEFNNRYVWDGNTGKVYFIDYSHGTSEATEVGRSFDDFLEAINVTPD